MVDLTKLNAGDVVLLRNGTEVNIESINIDMEAPFPVAIGGYTDLGEDFFENYLKDGSFSLQPTDKDIIKITNESCLLSFSIKINDETFGVL